MDISLSKEPRLVLVGVILCVSVIFSVVNQPGVSETSRFVNERSEKLKHGDDVHGTGG